MSKNRNGLPRSRQHLRVLELLRNRPITKTLKIISADTHLPEAWLLSLLRHPDMNPACNRIEILYEYLSKKRLEF